MSTSPPSHPSPSLSPPFPLSPPREHEVAPGWVRCRKTARERPPAHCGGGEAESLGRLPADSVSASIRAARDHKAWIDDKTTRSSTSTTPATERITSTASQQALTPVPSYLCC